MPSKMTMASQGKGWQMPYVLHVEAYGKTGEFGQQKKVFVRDTFWSLNTGN